MIIQGRSITAAENDLILDLMAQHRDWGGRTRLSEERITSTNHQRHRDMPLKASAGEPIGGSLGDLQPLSATLVESRSDDMGLNHTVATNATAQPHTISIMGIVSSLVRTT